MPHQQNATSTKCHKDKMPHQQNANDVSILYGKGGIINSTFNYTAYMYTRINDIPNS